MMIRIVRAADLRNSGTLIHKSFMLLAYANDIDIIGLNRRAVTAAFYALENCRLSLTVIEDKTKYMASTTKEAARMETSVSNGWTSSSRKSFQLDLAEGKDHLRVGETSWNMTSILLV